MYIIRNKYTHKLITYQKVVSHILIIFTQTLPLLVRHKQLKSKSV